MKKYLFLFSLLFSCALSGAIGIENGDRVAFLGDSITQLGGWQWPYTGYIFLVKDGLKTAGIEIDAIRAGVSGNHSGQMLARQKKDVLDKKPRWMFLCSGANDLAFHVSLEDFRKNMTKMVENARKEGVQVVLMTTVPRENNPERNRKLLPYVEFVRSCAKENRIFLVDVYKAMEEASASPELLRIKGYRLSYDGTHLNGFGHIVVACAILKECGFSDEKLASLRKKWMGGKRHALEIFLPVTAKEQLFLAREAKKRNMSLQEYLNELLLK
ncbi:MAG: hypothetical protein J6331_06275 [Lentisphaeria bacterium]|nr:hypothetical protein [Lentisphaeria bacterium]